MELIGVAQLLRILEKLSEILPPLEYQGHTDRPEGQVVRLLILVTEMISMHTL